MGYITTDDGVRLHYEISGAGKKTVVFVHGYFDNGANFAAISGKLQQKCRVVTYDHRAHGQSETPADGYTITRLAMDLKNLIDQLGLGTVIPVGYSMGTHVVWRYIELYGIESFEKVGLSVMSPKLITDENYHLGLNGDCNAQAALDMLFMLNRSMEEYNLRDLREDMTEEQKQAIRNNSDRIIANHAHGPMVRLLLAMFEHDFWPMLHKIACPALVIAGENDIYPTATHEEVHRRIPGSQLVILKDCGHLVMFERPEEYIHELANFID